MARDLARGTDSPRSWARGDAPANTAVSGDLTEDALKEAAKRVPWKLIAAAAGAAAGLILVPAMLNREKERR